MAPVGLVSVELLLRRWFWCCVLLYCLCVLCCGLVFCLFGFVCWLVCVGCLDLLRGSASLLWVWYLLWLLGFVCGLLAVLDCFLTH